MNAMVASNTEQELTLFPWRPGATSAWEKGAPAPGTLYVMPAAPSVRAGIAVAVALKGECIEDNRIWENQERHTQTHELWRRDCAE